MRPVRVLVVKIGSNSLVDRRGQLDAPYLDHIAGQFAALQRQGWRPVLVTSGAVATGMSRLALKERPPGLPERQALAAIGQIGLANLWEKALAAHGLVAAQLLLTYDDFTVRERYLNLVATCDALFSFGAVPVVNENDAVAVQELTVGDNDRLSALMAAQVGAERLVLLTDIAGMFDRDPRQDPSAQLLPLIPVVTAEVLSAAGGAGARGRGGMRSKVEAARLAAGAGVETVICHAREPRILERLVAGERIGTRIPGRDGRADARKRWLAVARKCKGRLHVDAGAASALAAKGRSLLPAGIVRIEGAFTRGDTVAIIDPSGEELARGLAGMSSQELEQVKGQRLDRAATTLGYALPDAAVHRDNLLLLT